MLFHVFSLFYCPYCIFTSARMSTRVRPHKTCVSIDYSSHSRHGTMLPQNGINKYCANERHERDSDSRNNTQKTTTTTTRTTTANSLSKVLWCHRFIRLCPSPHGPVACMTIELMCVSWAHSRAKCTKQKRQLFNDKPKQRLSRIIDHEMLIVSRYSIVFMFVVPVAFYKSMTNSKYRFVLLRLRF